LEKFDFFELLYVCRLRDINGAENDGDIILAKNLIFVKNFHTTGINKSLCSFMKHVKLYIKNDRVKKHTVWFFANV
jgi:hypothetical protein